MKLLAPLFIVSLAHSAAAATTILSTARSLEAYSSGYSFTDPFLGTVTVAPDDRRDNTPPGMGTSTLAISSAANYVGTGTASATSTISETSIRAFLTATAGNAVGGSPPGGLGFSVYSSGMASLGVSFSIDVPTLFQISGGSSGFSGPLGTASIDGIWSASYPPIIGGGAFAGTNSGILAPGTYQLNLSTGNLSVHPQAGYNPRTELELLLTLTPVPEPGTTALALGALLTLTRRSLAGSSGRR